MSSLDHKLSRTIFSFAIGWVEIKIFQFWDIGWKLKSHSLSSEKSQNGFSLITSSRLLEPIATYGIEFGWVELILWSFEDSPVTGSRGGEESQGDSLKITTCKNFLKAWVFKEVRYELGITSWCVSLLLELSNLMNMGQTASNPCTVDEISSKTRKNQLEFIWKIFASRSQWNKSHSIQISILWDSIENMFFTIKIKN